MDPERDFEFRFFRRVGAHSLYEVFNRRTRQVVFLGTLDECRRYLEVFQEKLARQMARKRLRHRPQPQTYRFLFGDRC